MVKREILFRGKRTDNGRWVEGLLYQISETLNPFIMLKNSLGESHEVLSKTVGQFTGLTDQNGVKIFEGDILKVSGELRSVVWDTQIGRWLANNIGEFRNAVSPRFFHLAEVVGNIHDNPELLEVAEDG